MLALWRDRRVRDILSQVGVGLVLVGLTVWFVLNASANLRQAGIASGFDFLGRTSGIEVAFVLTDYTARSSIYDLLVVGVVNTIVVSLLSIVAATLLGFLIGLARLSRHWLIATVAGVYVEIVRNIPLLVFVFFMYGGVLAALPGPRDSFIFFGISALNNRGFTIPVPVDGALMRMALLAVTLSIAAHIVLALVSKKRRDATGQGLPMGVIGAVLLVLFPLGVLSFATLMSTWDIPQLRGFNFRGGFVLVPEFVALFLALVTYTAGFIAEIVRGGIASVPKGQLEAARALGLSPMTTLRLVTVPLALRVIVPPMTSQYLNVLKNSSFGAAIAYPEVVSLFMGSALVATGQAVEIIAITLAIYLAIGLAVSAFMNWYNARVALVTR